MLLTYSNLNADELQGATLTDYLVSVEADFQVFDGPRVVYEEPRFPVLELARSLQQWIARRDDHDFVFESLSFEEIGVVTITHEDGGWVLQSSFTPSVRTTALAWVKMASAVRLFVSKVRADVRSLGIDDRRVLDE